jgi:hypothetical protein
METAESRPPAWPWLAAGGALLLCLESLTAAGLLWKRHLSGALGGAPEAEATAAGGGR